MFFFFKKSHRYCWSICAFSILLSLARRFWNCFKFSFFYSHFQLSAATYPNLYLGLGQLQVLGEFKTPASRDVLVSIELHFKLQSLVAAERRPLSPLPPFFPASPCDCRIKIVYDLIWLCRAVSSFEGSFEWKILSQLSNYEVNDLRRILKFNSPHLKESEFNKLTTKFPQTNHMAFVEIHFQQVFNEPIEDVDFRISSLKDVLLCHRWTRYLEFDLLTGIT